jgi:type I restriction enzyme R subunit
MRKLEDHMLLQTIARVNRLHEGKGFGYIIDYRDVLGALDTAMAAHRPLQSYDEKELRHFDRRYRTYALRVARAVA